MTRTIEWAGWRLFLALPDDLSQDRFLDLIAATASGREVPPMRRSRRASTFNVRLQHGALSPLSLFIKVLDPPRGLDWAKRKLRGAAVSHVFRITAALSHAGFNAPPVWAYGHHLASGREMIVTSRAAGRGPLRTLSQVDSASKRLLLKALGREIARLHRAGFIHGDLTPFNIFIVASESRFIFLDHERTRRVTTLGGRRQFRNLVQLGRFDLPGMTRTDRLRLLRAYTSEMGPGKRRCVERRITTMLARRVARDGGFERIAPLGCLSLSYQMVRH